MGQLTETLVNRINSTLNPDKVMGKPVDIEGMKIIPLVSYGFGFGAGMEVTSEKSGSGTGGGGGGGVTPSSILVITKDGEIKVMSAKKGALSDILTAAMPLIMEAIKSRRIGKERGGVHKLEENLKKGGHEPLSGDQVRELIADKRAIAIEHLLMMAPGLQCQDSSRYGWRGLSEMRRSANWK